MEPKVKAKCEAKYQKRVSEAPCVCVSVHLIVWLGWTEPLNSAFILYLKFAVLYGQKHMKNSIRETSYNTLEYDFVSF